jgi:hypothetical protein
MEWLYPMEDRQIPFSLRKRRKKNTHDNYGRTAEYRGQKIDDVFYLRTIEDGIRLGFEASDCSLIVETNKKMIEHCNR